ncbi:MFS general substrate transporter [Hortaea werneckii]|nr:MFS general substrate transporter [Hortaea werneckii]KAI7067063.1 MFS general substrate transporter [Hortaea werneckii]KAI7221205.1 MFS general substrate transporter [Hortaea werneckii]KAI7298974.1 MFS general substrate transporter [Hortaea werneckii]KAI7385778.1 MFS general substrate transporter [Hortaea werneckii]
MASEPVIEQPAPAAAAADAQGKKRLDWKAMLGARYGRAGEPSNRTSMSDASQLAPQKKKDRWNMGIMNDPDTDEVPGSILLLSKVSEYNEPLGLRNAPARTSASSLPSPYPQSRSSSMSRRRSIIPEKKRTPDGKIVLEPQPDDSENDPLNWPMIRRDLALLSLGFYCMVGGGMTPILAAGFKEVASDFDVSVPSVALTTGLYMMGLGVGSVLLSPTAILFGKRPVYLVAATCFILTSVWCALSPNFASLVVARIFQGIAVSSVECLPSATVAEIYFLHEKAYRLGIYTLLLLGGKNLVPLVSAAVIQSLHWRWVFWIVAIIAGFGLCLLVFFVPETFWDRTPVPHKHVKKRPSFLRNHSWSIASPTARRKSAPQVEDEKAEAVVDRTIGERKPERHAHFQSEDEGSTEKDDVATNGSDQGQTPKPSAQDDKTGKDDEPRRDTVAEPLTALTIPDNTGYFLSPAVSASQMEAGTPTLPSSGTLSPRSHPGLHPNAYIARYRSGPRKTYLQSLKPWSGRLSKDNWFRVALRPFILFAYPSILWSTLVYSLSVGWLIVLSESVAEIYQNHESYNFTPLQTGLVYISPFVGGVLGTAVAGKVSDIIVRSLARRNGGIYEPEFRLIMAIPIMFTTVIGLMGYGWSAEERDAWIVPTIFFGFISFGCSLGSTTSITFAVDSYRQYAGEALVTLNFSKNILHGLVFSLFFNKWLQGEGSKDVFVAIGGIQIACLLTTIPMYIYGKKARMWTVRKNLMEKF